MRLLIQRVTQASVRIDGEVVGEIGHGLLVLIGINAQDTPAIADRLIRKALDLRIFEDDEGKMNRGVEEVSGGLLLVSQFTLYANCRKGRRPSFIDAAPPPIAQPLYENCIRVAQASGLTVQTGRFGADMKISLINDGPVTIMLDSAELA
jgi:D-tyrosyl-tRNA(Tyr) deacylase